MANLINDIDTQSPEWVKAKAYFSDNPNKAKYSRKKSGLDHSFMNIDGTVYAMANKKQGHLGEGYHAVVKLGQTQKGENVAIRIEGEGEVAAPQPDVYMVPKKVDIYNVPLKANEEVSFSSPEDRLNAIQVQKKLGRLVAAVQIDLPSPKIQKLANNTAVNANKKHYIVEPWIPGVQLAKHISSSPYKGSEALIIAKKCARALYEIHQQGIIHGDVHAENFIIDKDGKNINVEIVDFELSKILPPGEDSVIGTKRGRKNMMSPELEKHGRYSAASDVYALGKMLQDSFLIPIPKPLRELINKMIDEDPNKRPSISEIPTELAIINEDFGPKMDQFAKAANDRRNNVVKPEDNIGQSHLNSNLQSFIKYKNESYIGHRKNVPFTAEQIIDDNGNCAAWSFMYQIYRSNNKDSEFKDILKVLASWDKSKASLQSTDLPPSLQKYGTLENLFDSVSNNIAILQGTADFKKETNLGYRYFHRVSEYNLIKDIALNRELTSVVRSPNQHADMKSLAQHLLFLSNWKNASIQMLVQTDLGRHAVSLFVRDDGKFDYYDPNILGSSKTFDSAEECAKYIAMQTISPISDDPYRSFRLEYNILKFHNDIDASMEMLTTPNLKKSMPDYNFFNDLHYAVLENRPEDLTRLLQSNPELLILPDATEITPLEWAFHCKNADCFKILINAYKEAGNDIGLKDLTRADLERDEVAFLISQAGKGVLDPNIGEDNDDLLTATLKKGNAEDLTGLLAIDGFAFKNDADFLSTLSNIDLQKLKVLASNDDFMREKFDGKTALQHAITSKDVGGHGLTVIKTLLANEKHINNVDSKGRTTLMHAVLEDRLDVVQILLDNNADIKKKDKKGKTAEDHLLAKLNADPPPTPEKAKAYRDVIEALHGHHATKVLDTLKDNKENISPPVLHTQVQKTVLGQYRTTLNKTKENEIAPENPVPKSIKMSNK